LVGAGFSTATTEPCRVAPFRRSGVVAEQPRAGKVVVVVVVVVLVIWLPQCLTNIRI